MRYINDPRYLLENENNTYTQRMKPRKVNVELRDAAEKSKEDYRKRHSLQVVTLRDIKAGREHSEDCVTKYLFK